MTIRRLFLIIVSLISFVLFTLLSQYVLSQKFQTVDEAISHAVYAYRNPYLTQLMIGITFMGGTLMLLILSTFLILALVYKKRKDEAFFFLITFSVGFCLSLLLKAVIGRVRPDIAPLMQELFYSYPSGHSMNACIFYALVAYFVYHFTRNTLLTILSTLLCGFLVISIGMSRIYLGVHYPSDVIAGFLAGIGWVTAVLVISRMIPLYSRRTKKKK